MSDRYKVMFTPVGWHVVDTVEARDPVAQYGLGHAEYARAAADVEARNSASATLERGTYARERDGAGHIYHSSTTWNDPAYGLAEYLGGRSTSSLYAWRRVTGAEHEAVWTLTHLAPGETWEYDGPDDEAPRVAGLTATEHYDAAADSRRRLALIEASSLRCPECGADVWDGPAGSKLAKCWNVSGHASGGTLAFDTMADDDESPRWIMIENTPGYLPDDDPATFHDLDDARDYLRERVADYVEHLHDVADWRDDYEPAITIDDDGLSAYVTDPDRIHDLGRAFSVSPIEN